MTRFHNLKSIAFITCIALIIIPSFAFAGDSFCVKFDPSIGIGHAFSPGNTEFTFRAHGPGFGGTTKTKQEYDYSALYLEAALPMTMWDRLEVTLSGSWALTLNEEDGRETVWAGALSASRDWEVDTDWMTADVNVAYAVVKDVLFIKSLSPIIGFRYDHWKTEFDNPSNESVIWNVVAPGDTAEFKQTTYAPYFGAKSTIGLPAAKLSDGKLKIGGDLKISAIYGPRIWGDVDYEEEKNFGMNRLEEIDGDLDSEDSWFYELFAEYTILSFQFTECTSGSMSLFAKYHHMNTEAEELDGSRSYSAAPSDYEDFSFKMDRPIAVFGGKVSIHF